VAEPPQRRHHPRRAAVRDGFSLHADTAVHGHDRQGLERLCRSGARGAVAESRLRRLDDGRYAYSPKKGTTFTVTASALVRRLLALLPPERLHLTSFHGGYAPNARLRPLITQPLASSQPAPRPSATPATMVSAPAKPTRPRLDWALLHQRTFGTDVLRCPCGGRRNCGDGRRRLPFGYATHCSCRHLNTSTWLAKRRGRGSASSKTRSP